MFQTLFSDIGLPRARLVGSAVVKSDTEAVPYIMSAEHDPEIEVVLEANPGGSLDGGVPTGSVEWSLRQPDQLELSVMSDRAAFLVISDNWFPAWRATVDDEHVDVLRANHTLRAIRVPEGRSTVRMWYESSSLSWTKKLSVGAILILLGCGGIGLTRTLGRNEGSGVGNPEIRSEGMSCLLYTSPSPRDRG